METTLIPFSTLPACATLCGHLFDANGACVPPAAPTADAGTYDRCFCSQPVLQPFSAGVSGVCDEACTGANAAGITTIQNWYTSFCDAANGKAAVTPTSGSTGGTSAASSDKGGGGWISNHYQWVIMLVILVVGITGIWVGACVWRRRYLVRRDRQHALGKAAAARGSWGPGAAAPGSGSATPAPGQFMPGSDPATAESGEGEKPAAWKKWTSVGRRT